MQCIDAAASIGPPGTGSTKPTYKLLPAQDGAYNPEDDRYAQMHASGKKNAQANRACA